MKNNLFIAEIVISIGLVLLLIILANPKGVVMPSTIETWLFVLITILFLAFVGLIWREKVLDEREELHRLHAGRVSFLIGSAILIVGIMVQAYYGEIDPWLITTFTAMVASKIISRIYTDIKQ